jgi:hypothetical protein
MAISLGWLREAFLSKVGLLTPKRIFNMAEVD